TKVMLVTHLINITGQVLPVKKICDMAHSYGVEVICDSAHAFAQLDFKIPDLNCDYFGCSLHKWLCTPLGMGLLYVKKENIEKVWPLFGDDTYADDDIRKFEHLGTQPVHTHLALSNAIDFHLAIGATKKEERLKLLRKYWTDKVKDNPKVTLNMPLEDSRASALGNIAIDGYSPSELAIYFMEKHKIFTVAIDRQTVKGVRVTPHLYTSYEELDKFVKAVEQA
ncbi:MAG: aminotransferase class V-fold PLP-dependent enzyme, partial [Cyclobacteriaceae bacterium]|nr:aminotransferase class V-fold PLP-dependent enzyme [Cyclobacteriaceae bacterium]